VKETPSPLHEDTPDTTLVDLARRTSELAVAAASVIDHRTRQMANAGLTPNEHQEFALMGQEKMDAALESTQAMIAEMLAMHQWLVQATLQQLSASAAAIASLFTAQTPADLVQAQVTLASEMLATLQSAGEKAAAYLTSTAAQGLRPVHSRATANAQRLANINLPDGSVTGQG
jgi:Phasin protein